MLLKYIVSNFKSIGHPVEFCMIPTDENTDERFLTTLDADGTKIKVLRRGGFFGPNASGKSAFVESIRFARDYIVESKKSGKNTGVPQYKGNLADLDGVSLFQFMFYVDNNVYEYGFSLTANRVSEEWLMILKNEELVPLFTRATDEDGNTEIDIEDEFGCVESTERKLAEILKTSIKSNQRNQLFLYKLKENGIERAEKIVGWFEKMQIIFPYSKIQWLPVMLKEGEDFREFLSKTLSRLDTGVNRIKVQENKISLQELAAKKSLPDELIDEIENNSSGIFNSDGKYYVFFEEQNKKTLLQLKFEHKLNNRAVHFNINDESDGTRRLLDLLPILFQMEKGSNAIYFVDEIDRSLHTKLSKYILNTFAQKSEDALSQIVFTAHDVNLINLRDFAKEEIWFIEKNSVGETLLKPFSDFDLGEGQNIVKDYLNGRFGAIPVIRGEQ